MIDIIQSWILSFPNPIRNCTGTGHVKSKVSSTHGKPIKTSSTSSFSFSLANNYIRIFHLCRRLIVDDDHNRLYIVGNLHSRDIVSIPAQQQIFGIITAYKNYVLVYSSVRILFFSKAAEIFPAENPPR